MMTQMTLTEHDNRKIQCLWNLCILLLLRFSQALSKKDLNIGNFRVFCIAFFILKTLIELGKIERVLEFPS